MTDTKPSVLRQKLSAKNSSSNSVKSMSSLWASIGKASVKSVKPILEEELVIENMDLTKCSFDEMKKQLDEKVPVFSLRAGDIEAAGFLHFSPGLAARITDKKLGGEKEEDDEEAAELSLLDLYLLDPMARNLLQAIDAAFAEIDTGGIFADMAFTARCLSLQELSAFDEEADFMQATFTLAIQTDEEDGVVAHKESEDITITCCFVYPMLERLSVQVPRRSDDMLDFSNPWTEHMHSTVLSTEVPVAAVLENCAMSIGECSRFEIGQVINLPGSSLEMLTLKVKTKEGERNMAFSALGVIKQHKAVKLLEDPAAMFIADLPELMNQSSL